VTGWWGGVDSGGVLTGEQQGLLETVGWVRLPGVVGRAVADGMADAVWASLAARGVERDRPATWPEGLVTKHQGLRKLRRFDAFGTAPATVGLVDELLGVGCWRADQAWGPALVTFPEPGPWTLPHKVWHVDLPGRGDPDTAEAVRLFGYASDVVSRGGATLVVEGSHELVRRMVAAAPDHDAGGSADLRRKLLAHPWFRALSREGPADRVRPFMVDGDEIDGVHVRVAELTARAGDVVVMHPWTLHNFSMNCADAPRFMVTHTVFRVPARSPAED
jgi:hypothetical protein